MPCDSSSPPVYQSPTYTPSTPAVTDADVEFMYGPLAVAAPPSTQYAPIVAPTIYRQASSPAQTYSAASDNSSSSGNSAGLIFDTIAKAVSSAAAVTSYAPQGTSASRSTRPPQRRSTGKEIFSRAPQKNYLPWIVGAGALVLIAIAVVSMRD